MRVALAILACLGVMGLSVWAYHENYATKAAIAEMDALEREIGRTRAAIALMEAEWAYLNRPARLRQLAEMNFGHLGLVAMTPDRFGVIAELPYAPEAVAALPAPEAAQ